MTEKLCITIKEDVKLSRYNKAWQKNSTEVVSYVIRNSDLKRDQWGNSENYIH